MYRRKSNSNPDWSVKTSLIFLFADCKHKSVSSLARSLLKNHSPSAVAIPPDLLVISLAGQMSVWLGLGGTGDVAIGLSWKLVVGMGVAGGGELLYPLGW